MMERIAATPYALDVVLAAMHVHLANADVQAVALGVLANLANCRK